MSASGQALAEQASADVLGLWEYFQFYVEETPTSLTLHACHQAICELYEAAVLGELSSYEYITVNMPRRTGKTQILVALASWMLGEFPTSQLLYGSYSDKLVLRTMANSQRILERPWYRDLYGDILHGRRADLVTTTAGGYMYGAGTMATIVGFGAGLKEPAGGYIALDDPSKPDEVLSVIERENVVRNFETTWKGCRNSDRHTPIFVNMQRLGTDDLCGYLRSTYPNKTYVLKIPCFVAGRSSFPETWSDSTHEDLGKTSIGRYVRATQFQQDGAVLGGNLIKTDLFNEYQEDPDAIEFEQKVMTCDTGLSSKTSSDWSVVQCWGKRNKRFYLIDQIRGQWDAPALLECAATFRDKNHTAGSPVRRFVIEDKAAGPGLLQSLRKLGIPVHAITPLKDKVQRVQDVLQYHENGLVFIPPSSRAPWVKEFVSECAAFRLDGKATHDDMVDCYAYALAELGGRATWFDSLYARQNQPAPQPA